MLNAIALCGYLFHIWLLTVYLYGQMSGEIPYAMLDIQSAHNTSGPLGPSDKLYPIPSPGPRQPGMELS